MTRKWLKDSWNILQIFCVPSDGNCGLYALINAINDHRDKKVVSLSSILALLGIEELPNYWWHDDQLAGLATYHGFDIYIFRENQTWVCLCYKHKTPP